MSVLDKPRSLWQRSIERFHPIGMAPFIGGVALADSLLKKDLNEVLEITVTLGTGVWAHNRFHNLMGTEVVIHNPDDGDGVFQWRVKQPTDIPVEADGQQL